MPKVDNEKLIDIWSIDDVQTVAPGLDDQQALEVLHHLNHEYDSEYGINNQVIHNAAEWLYPGSTEEDLPSYQQLQFSHWLCDLHVSSYSTTNCIALELFAAVDDEETDTVEGEPVAMATINLIEIPLEPGQVIIKDYSENEGMYDALYKAGVVGPAVRRIDVGRAIRGGVVCHLSTDLLKGLPDDR